MMSTVTSEARALAALGHDARLRSFRRLVRAGAGGLNAGELGAHPGLPPPTLARHLSAPVAAGPVLQTSRGRVRNRADFAAARALADFRLSECCAGLPHPPAGSGPLPEPAG